MVPFYPLVIRDVPCGKKLLREFIFADWLKLLTDGQVRENPSTPLERYSGCQRLF